MAKKREEVEVVVVEEVDVDGRMKMKEGREGEKCLLIYTKLWPLLICEISSPRSACPDNGIENKNWEQLSNYSIRSGVAARDGSDLRSAQLAVNHGGISQSDLG